MQALARLFQAGRKGTGWGGWGEGRGEGRWGGGRGGEAGEGRGGGGGGRGGPCVLGVLVAVSQLVLTLRHRFKAQHLLRSGL